MTGGTLGQRTLQDACLRPGSNIAFHNEVPLRPPMFSAPAHCGLLEAAGRGFAIQRRAKKGAIVQVSTSWDHLKTCKHPLGGCQLPEPAS
jgi:hypothetical protein